MNLAAAIRYNVIFSIKRVSNNSTNFNRYYYNTYDPEQHNSYPGPFIFHLPMI